MVEALEQRTFLSASVLAGIQLQAPPDALGATVLRTDRAAKLNLLNLLGYNKTGARWNYGGNYKLSGPTGTKSGSGPVGISVGKLVKILDGHRTYTATAAFGDGTKISTGWFSDTSGTGLASLAVNSSAGILSARLHDFSVTPPSVVVGRQYSDTGTFDGSAGVVVGGVRLNGKLKGTVKGGAKLLGNERIRVEAGTFEATKSVQDLILNGKLTLTHLGMSVAATYTVSMSTTFWTVSSRGVVKSVTSLSIHLKAPVIGEQIIRFSASANLKP